MLGIISNPGRIEKNAGSLDENKFCGIYKITNPVGSIYIGQSNHIIRRIYKYTRLLCEQQFKLYNSLKKYGWENHTFEIITLCSMTELNNWEIYYIKLYDTFETKHGLNLRSGGKGKNICSEETREKLRKANLGKKYSKETNLKKGLHGKGRPLSEEVKAKMKFAQQNRTNEHIQNKLKNAAKGERNGSFGKRWSEKRRKKHSESVSGRNSVRYGIPSPRKGIRFKQTEQQKDGSRKIRQTNKLAKLLKMNNETLPKVAILIIATNKYKTFIKPVISGIVKNFLPNHVLSIHLFTDEYINIASSKRLAIRQHTIPSYNFPDATLLRYKIFSDNSQELSKYDFLIYSDVDMDFCARIDEKFLNGDLIAVRHPGFYTNNGWGSGGNPTASLSFIEPEFQKKYFAGGIQGGKSEKYLIVCKLLANNIEKDTSNNIIAIWHDETHWNAFLNKTIHEQFPNWTINELDPSYCTVPSIEQRRAWGIDHLPAKILALDKDHKAMRE